MEQRHIDTRYTIMIRRSGTYLASDGKWYYLRNKEIDTSYTGMAKNEYGWWYIKQGKLDKTYTGKITCKGTTYDIVKGKVVE